MTDHPQGPDVDPSDPMRRQGRRCAAKSRTTGGQCRQLAVTGATVCYWHGGAAPQVRAAAKRRLDEAEADRIATRFDLSAAPPLTEPVSQLARVAGQAVYLLDRIAETSAGTDVAGMASDLNPRFIALERALDRAMKILVDVNRLGLAEKQVMLNEATASVLVTVVTGMVGDLGHDLEDPGIRQTVLKWLTKAKALEASGVEA